MDERVLAARLRQIRRAAGLSQASLAASVGFGSSASVAKVENGTLRIRVVEFVKWCEACGTSGAAVLSGDPIVIEAAS